MKPRTKSNELSVEELRNLSLTERLQLFVTWKEKMQSANADVSTEQTQWHMIDEDMAPDQYEEIPPALPGDTRTPVLWIKFRHPELDKVLVSRGRFDHDGGTWTARLSSVEDGDLTGQVIALAWARIVPGERPWEGCRR